MQTRSARRFMKKCMKEGFTPEQCVKATLSPIRNKRLQEIFDECFNGQKTYKASEFKKTSKKGTTKNKKSKKGTRKLRRKN